MLRNSLGFTLLPFVYVFYPNYFCLCILKTISLETSTSLFIVWHDMNMRHIIMQISPTTSPLDRGKLFLFSYLNVWYLCHGSFELSLPLIWLNNPQLKKSIDFSDLLKYTLKLPIIINTTYLLYLSDYFTGISSYNIFVNDKV